MRRQQQACSREIEILRDERDQLNVQISLATESGSMEEEVLQGLRAQLRKVESELKLRTPTPYV